MRKEVVRCDVCGKTEDINSKYNMMIPEDWMEYRISPSIHSYHLCPVCAKKMLESVV